MNKQLKIYGSYLFLLGLITAAIMFMGLPTNTGLLGALLVAAVYAVFWPRWG